MKRKSTIITVSAIALLALMISLLAIDDKGFAAKVLCYIIPFFTLAFGTYGLLRGLAKRYIWLQENRNKMLNKSIASRMLAILLPAFAAAYAALSISNTTDACCVIAGLVLGAAYGFASYFTTEKFI